MIVSYDFDIDVARAFEQLHRNVAANYPFPPRLMSPPDDDSAYTVLARVIEHRHHDVIRLEPHRFRAEIAGQVDVIEQTDKVRGPDFLDGFRRRLDVNREPVCTQLLGQPRGFTEQRAAIGGI